MSMSRTVVAAMAHPDDIEFLCAGTLRLLVECGWTLRCVTLSGGDIGAGTDASVRYSTKEPKTFWMFRRDKDQWWQKTDLGFQTPFKTITGAIFEPGFPDVILQMWAAFVAEREGRLGDSFGCVTPEEAVASHALFAAALDSHREQRVVPVG